MKEDPSSDPWHESMGGVLLASSFQFLEQGAELTLELSQHEVSDHVSLCRLVLVGLAGIRVRSPHLVLLGLLDICYQLGAVVVEVLDGGMRLIFSQIGVPCPLATKKIPDNGEFTVFIFEEVSPMTMSEVLCLFQYATIDQLAATGPELVLCAEGEKISLRFLPTSEPLEEEGAGRCIADETELILLNALFLDPI